MTDWNGVFIFNKATHWYDLRKVITSQGFQKDTQALETLLDQVDPDKSRSPIPIPILIHPIVNENDENDEMDTKASPDEKKAFDKDVAKMKVNKRRLNKLSQFATEMARNKYHHPEFGTSVCAFRALE